MTRLIKLIMVAAIVVASVAQAQLFNEDYTGATEPDQAYVTSNGVEWVSGTGLTISNSAAIFEYKGTASVTNTEVAFTVIPVLNDAIPTDVDGAAVVFWVGTDSNVYRLVTGGTTVSNDTVNAIQGDGSVDFFVKINYVAKTFSLKVNGTDFASSTVVFTDSPFYDTTPEQLSSIEIRETSDSGVAVVEIFEVQELDANGDPTAADDVALKVYEKGGKVYVELEVSTNGASTSFDVYRDGVLIGTITYVDGQSVYTIEDAGAVVGETYNYSVTDLENGVPVGDFNVDITVLPVLEAKAFQMTQTQMTLVFASVPGETYKVVGLTALIDGTSSIVADDIVADSYETSVLVEIGDNFYFKIIKK